MLLFVRNEHARFAIAMRFAQRLLALQCLATAALAFLTFQTPLQAPAHATLSHNISTTLFAELEELARIVDISYCVGVAGLGITKPFQCASRCNEFPDFELVNVSVAPNNLECPPV